MSAFIVSDEVLNKVLHGLYSTPACRSVQGIQLRDSFGYVSQEACDQIGQSLRALNILAVSSRYPGTVTADLPPYSARIRRPIGNADLFNAYEPHETAALTACCKALDCLLYQCAEGAVPESSLYAELRAALAEVAKHLVRTSSSYKHSPWGS